MRTNKSIKSLIPAIAATSMLVGCGDNFNLSDLEVDGLYYVESSFSTPRGVPEEESNELSLFLDLSGRPDRVSGWVLELLEDELDEPYKSALRYARNGVEADEEFQKFLEEDAPELVDSLAALADNVSQVTTSINLMSELTLETYATDELRGVAEQRITGVIYRVDGVEYRYDLPEIGVAEPQVMITDFLLHESNRDYAPIISFGNERLDLQYGQMLDYALNEIVAEKVDPFADSFTELVSSLVPCKAAGEWLSDRLDFGPSEVYGTACAAAIDKAAQRLLPLEMHDMNIVMDFSGDAELIEDDDKDKRVDGLSRGEWEGTLAYPTETIHLRRPDHSFFANRNQSRRNNDDIRR